MWLNRIGIYTGTKKKRVTSLVIVSNKEIKKEESTKEKSEHQNSITYNEKQ